MVTQIAPNGNGKVIQQYFAKFCRVFWHDGNRSDLYGTRPSSGWSERSKFLMSMLKSAPTWRRCVHPLPTRTGMLQLLALRVTTSSMNSCTALVRSLGRAGAF